MKLRRLVLVFSLLLFVVSAIAHPPKKVTLKFDIKTQELDVKIAHAVKDMNEHFIDNITVTVNGKEVLKTDYKKQKDLKADVYRLKLENIKAGDLIELTASCNKWGKKKKSLTIE